MRRQKAVIFWVIGVVLLESAVSFVGMTGGIAADQGLIPSLFAGGAADVADNLSEYIIPTLAISPHTPLVLGLVLVATMIGHHRVHGRFVSAGAGRRT